MGAIFVTTSIFLYNIFKLIYLGGIEKISTVFLRDVATIQYIGNIKKRKKTTKRITLMISSNLEILPIIDYLSIKPFIILTRINARIVAIIIITTDIAAAKPS